jgi:hypothetical protein
MTPDERNVEASGVIDRKVRIGHEWQPIMAEGATG